MKTRLTLMVDLDVAQYYEARYRLEVMKEAEAGNKVPSFSAFMNKLLKGYAGKDHSGEIEGGRGTSQA